MVMIHTPVPLSIYVPPRSANEGLSRGPGDIGSLIRKHLGSVFWRNYGDDSYTRTAFNLCTAAIGQRGTISGARGHRELYKEALGERFLP